MGNSISSGGNANTGGGASGSIDDTESDLLDYKFEQDKHYFGVIPIDKFDATIQSQVFKTIEQMDLSNFTFFFKTNPLVPKGLEYAEYIKINDEYECLTTQYMTHDQEGIIVRPFEGENLEIKVAYDKTDTTADLCFDLSSGELSEILVGLFSSSKSFQMFAESTTRGQFFYIPRYVFTLTAFLQNIPFASVVDAFEKNIFKLYWFAMTAVDKNVILYIREAGTITHMKRLLKFLGSKFTIERKVDTLGYYVYSPKATVSISINAKNEIKVGTLQYFLGSSNEIGTNFKEFDYNVKGYVDFNHHLHMCVVPDTSLQKSSSFHLYINHFPYKYTDDGKNNNLAKAFIKTMNASIETLKNQKIYMIFHLPSDVEASHFSKLKRIESTSFFSTFDISNENSPLFSELNLTIGTNDKCDIFLDNSGNSLDSAFKIKDYVKHSTINKSPVSSTGQVFQPPAGKFIEYDNFQKNNEFLQGDLNKLIITTRNTPFILSQVKLLMKYAKNFIYIYPGETRTENFGDKIKRFKFGQLNVITNNLSIIIPSSNLKCLQIQSIRNLLFNAVNDTPDYLNINLSGSGGVAGYKIETKYADRIGIREYIGVPFIGGVSQCLSIDSQSKGNIEVVTEYSTQKYTNFFMMNSDTPPEVIPLLEDFYKKNSSNIITAYFDSEKRQQYLFNNKNFSLTAGKTIKNITNNTLIDINEKASLDNPIVRFKDDVVNIFPGQDDKIHMEYSNLLPFKGPISGYRLSFTTNNAFNRRMVDFEFYKIMVTYASIDDIYQLVHTVRQMNLKDYTTNQFAWIIKFYDYPKIDPISPFIEMLDKEQVVYRQQTSNCLVITNADKNLTQDSLVTTGTVIQYGAYRVMTTSLAPSEIPQTDYYLGEDKLIGLSIESTVNDMKTWYIGSSTDVVYEIDPIYKDWVRDGHFVYSLDGRTSESRAIAAIKNMVALTPSLVIVLLHWNEFYRKELIEGLTSDGRIFKKESANKSSLLLYTDEEPNFNDSNTFTFRDKEVRVSTTGIQMDDLDASRLGKIYPAFNIECFKLLEIDVDAMELSNFDVFTTVIDCDNITEYRMLMMMDLMCSKFDAEKQLIIIYCKNLPNNLRFTNLRTKVGNFLTNRQATSNKIKIGNYTISYGTGEDQDIRLVTEGNIDTIAGRFVYNPYMPKTLEQQLPFSGQIHNHLQSYYTYLEDFEIPNELEASLDIKIIFCGEIFFNDFFKMHQLRNLLGDYIVLFKSQERVTEFVYDDIQIQMPKSNIATLKGNTLNVQHYNNKFIPIKLNDPGTNDGTSIYMTFTSGTFDLIIPAYESIQFSEFKGFGSISKTIISKRTVSLLQQIKINKPVVRNANETYFSLVKPQLSAAQETQLSNLITNDADSSIIVKYNDKFFTSKRVERKEGEKKFWCAKSYDVYEGEFIGNRIGTSFIEKGGVLYGYPQLAYPGDAKDFGTTLEVIPNLINVIGTTYRILPTTPIANYNKEMSDSKTVPVSSVSNTAILFTPKYSDINHFVCLIDSALKKWQNGILILRSENMPKEVITKIFDCAMPADRMPVIKTSPGYSLEIVEDVGFKTGWVPFPLYILVSPTGKTRFYASEKASHGFTSVNAQFLLYNFATPNSLAIEMNSRMSLDGGFIETLESNKEMKLIEFLNRFFDVVVMSPGRTNIGSYSHKNERVYEVAKYGSALGYDDVKSEQTLDGQVMVRNINSEGVFRYEADPDNDDKIILEKKDNDKTIQYMPYHDEECRDWLFASIPELSDVPFSPCKLYIDKKFPSELREASSVIFIEETSFLQFLAKTLYFQYVIAGMVILNSTENYFEILHSPKFGNFLRHMGLRGWFTEAKYPGKTSYYVTHVKVTAKREPFTISSSGPVTIGYKTMEIPMMGFKEPVNVFYKD